MTTRTCGDCQLCCKLLPVRELHKRANTRCKHQRHAKGCKIYGNRPISCLLWSCRWRADASLDLPRPDRCHYAVDVLPDYLELETGGKRYTAPVIQIWADPAHPRAHWCQRLVSYLEAQYLAGGHIGLVRFGSHNAKVLLPPHVTGLDFWTETIGVSKTQAEHSPKQIQTALARPPQKLDAVLASAIMETEGKR